MCAILAGEADCERSLFMKTSKGVLLSAVLAVFVLFLLTSCPSGEIKLPDIDQVLDQILDKDKPNSGNTDSTPTTSPNSGPQTSGTPTGEDTSPNTPDGSGGMNEDTPGNEPAEDGDASETPIAETPIAEECPGGCPSVENAVEMRCINNECVIWRCAGNYVNCNSLYNDGCEADTANDQFNCGGCATVCQSVAHNTSEIECRLGQCVVGACNAGWYDCDRRLQNGCETNAPCS